MDMECLTVIDHVLCLIWHPIPRSTWGAKGATKEAPPEPNCNEVQRLKNPMSIAEQLIDFVRLGWLLSRICH